MAEADAISLTSLLPQNIQVDIAIYDSDHRRLWP